MRIFSLLVAILWCISGDAVAGGAVTGGAVVSTAPTNNTQENTILGGAVVSTAPIHNTQGDAISGGAVVSTAPDYPDTDRSVQLRQLHPLQLHPLQLHPLQLHPLQQQLLQQQPQKQHPIRENALMLGVGYTNILDTYLSPEKYRGTDVRFISHTRRENDSARFVHQLLHEGNIAFADNRSGNGGEIAGGYTFGYSLLRKWQMPVGSCGLRLLAGGTAELSAGFLYNTRGSNNPAQARFALQLKPTVAADFDFRLFKRQKRPFTLHYEASAPLCGLMFSPNYGQSYYEIFSRGNYDHNCVPTTVASTPSLRQMLTLDFRALHTTWRIGYLGDWRQANVNNLKQHTYTHALVIGIVRRFRTVKL